MKNSNNLPTVEELESYFRCDFDKGILYKYKFKYNFKPQPMGYKDSKGYLRVLINGERNFSTGVHRIIYYMYHKINIDNLEIDHINGIVDDNRIENLRVATSSQNNHNCKWRNNNTSGIKGVSWHKRSQMWRADICVNYKQIWLGSFRLKEEAEEAVKQYREKLHLNFTNHGKKQ